MFSSQTNNVCWEQDPKCSREGQFCRSFMCLKCAGTYGRLGEARWGPHCGAVTTVRGCPGVMAVCFEGVLTGCTETVGALLRGKMNLLPGTYMPGVWLPTATCPAGDL